MMTTVEDDDLVDLPPLPKLGDDEELANDLAGLGAMVPDDDRPTSMDDSVGLDGLDEASFVPLVDEPTAIGDDEKGGLDGLEHAPSNAEDEEYGYTEGDEPLHEIELGDAVVVEMRSLTGEDGGAEGIAGLSSLQFEGDDDIAGLPPLHTLPGDKGEDGLMDELDVGVTLDFDGDTGEEDPRLAGSLLPPAHPALVDWSLRASVEALAVDGSGNVFAGGEGMHRYSASDRTWTRLVARGLEEAEILSVAVHGELIVVGTRLHGVWVSSDGGEHFEARNEWASGRDPSVGCRVLFDASGRLWMWAGGALHRSRDGSRWLGPLLPVPISEVVADGEGVAALALTAEGPTLFVSTDGVRWARRVLSFGKTGAARKGSGSKDGAESSGAELSAAESSAAESSAAELKGRSELGADSSEGSEPTGGDLKAAESNEAGSKDAGSNDATSKDAASKGAGGSTASSAPWGGAATEAALSIHRGKALLALPHDSAGPWVEGERGSSARVVELAGVERLLTDGKSLYGARHIEAGDRFVLLRFAEGEAQTLVDVRSEEAAVSDGNHQVLDALVAPDGALWFALGGGIARVVPQ